MVLRRISWSLFFVVLIGVLARALAMSHGAGAFDDPDKYLTLARSVAAGDGFILKGRPTAYRPPLYPLLLIPSLVLPPQHVNLGIALTHLLLAGATIWLTAIAARGFGYSTARSLVAAFVVACDPVLIWQARSVMTETPTAFFLACALAGFSWRGRPGAVLGGLGLGLSALCRPSMLAGAALTVAAALFMGPGRFFDRVRNASLIAITIGVVLSPWMIRNLVVLGEPVWTTTHGGYTLALANNAVYYDDILNGPPGRVWTGHDQWLWWDSAIRATAGMSEPVADRYMRRAVWRLARERPADFARATIARIAHFWSLAPAAAVYSPAVRAVTIAWTLPVWLAALAGLARRASWRWPIVTGPLAAMGLMVVHSLFWTDIRMRAPIVPAIAILAASARWPLGGKARSESNAESPEMVGDN